MSDQFTTQIDLLTGNPFYESQWGKLFAILPPEIAEDIAREIWRECFTRLVLKPPHLYDYWSPIRHERIKFQNKGDCLLHFNKYPVCHCFNKDGSMCGVNDAPNRYLSGALDEEDTVMNVPQLTCGVSKSQTAMTRYRGLRRDGNGRREWSEMETTYTKVRMCDKHYKEMCAGNSWDYSCDYVNKMLTKWGWGERNGYPIRVGDGHKTDIKYSGRLQKKLDKNDMGEYKWRKPICDYVVESRFKRRDGILRRKTSRGQYIDFQMPGGSPSHNY
jgi:hypothetical protein